MLHSTTAPRLAHVIRRTAGRSRGAVVSTHPTARSTRHRLRTWPPVWRSMYCSAQRDAICCNPGKAAARHLHRLDLRLRLATTSAKMCSDSLRRTTQTQTAVSVAGCEHDRSVYILTRYLLPPE